MINRTGEQIGNYRLVRKIGQGAFSEVYLGEHIYLRTQAAIKILHMRLAQHTMQNFLTEARTIAHLIHPNIVRIIDFGIEHDTPFLVMDYAPNGTLRHHHPHGSLLAPLEIVPYINQLASALQYAHNQRLIHRDIKPENILVGRNNDILLSDFGIALVAQSSLYQSNQDVVGTVGYMAPEQIQGKPHPASDQYSLAIAIYEWLTGELPFHGSFTEVCAQHMFATPPPLREKVPTIPSAVDQVVQRALAKDPYHRFATILDFAQAFEQASQFRPPIRLPSKPVQQISSSQFGQYSKQIPESTTLSQFSSTLSTNAAPFPQPQTNHPSSTSRRDRFITPITDKLASSLSPYPQQPSTGNPSHPQQPASIMAPLPPTQYPATTPSIGTSPAPPTGNQSPAPSPTPSPSPWKRLTASHPAVGALTKPRVWSIRIPQIIAMIIGAILFGALSHIIAYWHLTTSGSNFLNDGLALPATIISLFFGTLFGPWVGAITGGLGAFIGDYIFMFYLNHYASPSILNNGIWHASPLTNVSIWLGFIPSTNTNWTWIISNALIGFISGLALIGTRGRYVTFTRIILAELLSVIAVLVGLALLIATNTWHPAIPYDNLTHYSTADTLNLGFTYIILPTLALALTTLSFLLPLTNAFTRSRE